MDNNCNGRGEIRTRRALDKFVADVDCPKDRVNVGVSELRLPLPTRDGRHSPTELSLFGWRLDFGDAREASRLIDHSNLISYWSRDPEGADACA